MSMYGVNASVPKTLVRHLVKYAADVTADPKLQEVLYDVLDTPVSPELLPPKDGDIAQKTEDLVGPYELHDFYLYFMLRFGYEPGKIYRLAMQTFEGVYEKETILKWLTTFADDFSTNSLSAPVCRTDRRSGQWHSHQEETGECQAMRVPKCGCVIWRKFPYKH